MQETTKTSDQVPFISGPEDEVSVLDAAANPGLQATPIQQDRPLYGIFLIIAASAMIAGADGVTKFLARSLPVNETAWFRFVTTVAVVLIVMAATTGFRSGLRTARPGLQITRGLVQVFSTLGFLFALSAAPIVDVTATVFSAPLMVTALSIVMLREPVGMRRWLAAIIGLIGVLIMIRPGSSGFNAALLWAVLGAFLYALVMIITRQLSVNENSTTTMAYSSIVAFVVLTIMLPFIWVTPTIVQAAICLFLGLLYAAAHWLIIIAFRYADASVLAPFSYFQLVSVAVIGVIIYGEVPDGWSVAGIVIIVASGLYTAQHERSRRVTLQHEAKA